MVGGRWPFAEKWTWTGAVFQEQKTYSSFVHSELSWGLSDNWRTDLAADIIMGSGDSALGLYEDNDRETLRLNYLF